VQRCRPVRGLDCHVSTMLNKQACGCHMSLSYGEMQRPRLLIEAPRIHILWMLNDQDLHKSRLAHKKRRNVRQFHAVHRGL